MCSKQYAFEREKDIVALIEIILDIRNVEGICFGGILAETVVFSEILASLTTFLGGLKYKQLEIPKGDAQDWAVSFVSQLIQQRQDSVMIEHLLNDLPEL